MKHILVQLTALSCAVLLLCSYGHASYGGGLNQPSREILMPLCGSSIECLKTKLKLREIERKRAEINGGRRKRDMGSSGKKHQLYTAILRHEQHISPYFRHLYFLYIQRKVKMRNKHGKRRSFRKEVIVSSYTRTDSSHQNKRSLEDTLTTHRKRRFPAIQMRIPVANQNSRRKREISEKSSRQKRVVNANYYDTGIGMGDFYDYDYEYDFAYDITDRETMDDYYDEEIARQEQIIANSGFDEAQVKEDNRGVVMDTDKGNINVVEQDEMTSNENDKTESMESGVKSKGSQTGKTSKSATKVKVDENSSHNAKSSKKTKDQKSKSVHKSKTSKNNGKKSKPHTGKSSKESKSQESEGEGSAKESGKKVSPKKNDKNAKNIKSSTKQDNKNKTSGTKKTSESKKGSSGKTSKNNKTTGSSKSTKTTKTKSGKSKATKGKASDTQTTGKPSVDNSGDDNDEEGDDNYSDAESESADDSREPGPGQIEHLLAKLNTLIGDIENSESSVGRGVITIANGLVNDEGNKTGSCSAFTHTTMASGYKSYVNYVGTRVVSVIPYIVDGDETFLLHHLDKTMKDNNLKLSIELRSKSCHCIKGLHVKAVPIGGKHNAMLTKFTLEYLDGGWNFVHNQDGKMKLFAIAGTLAHDSVVPFHRRIYSTALRVFPQDWMRLPWVRVKPIDCG